MPYGDLAREAVQRFATHADLDKADCSVEEREEYEPHLAIGNTVYAGVDYARILELVEQEADIVLWDGGNNDFPFYHPDLHIVLVDPLRAGHELNFHPGETVLRMADVVVIAKTDAASADDIESCAMNVRSANPGARLLHANSPIQLDGSAELRGKRVLVIEDGPTLTHGGMAYGAGFIAASRAHATIVDPRPYAAPAIASAFTRYPHIGPVLPALGYSKEQLEALRQTIERAKADLVVCATPMDLGALIHISKPVLHARYKFAEAGAPELSDIVEGFLRSRVG
jgi:predicted GTPase